MISKQCDIEKEIRVSFIWNETSWMLRYNNGFNGQMSTNCSMRRRSSTIVLSHWDVWKVVLRSIGTSIRILDEDQDGIVNTHTHSHTHKHTYMNTLEHNFHWTYISNHIGTSFIADVRSSPTKWIVVGRREKKGCNFVLTAASLFLKRLLHWHIDIGREFSSLSTHNVVWYKPFKCVYRINVFILNKNRPMILNLIQVWTIIINVVHRMIIHNLWTIIYIYIYRYLCLCVRVYPQWCFIMFTDHHHQLPKSIERVTILYFNSSLYCLSRILLFVPSLVRAFTHSHTHTHPPTQRHIYNLHRHNQLENELMKKVIEYIPWFHLTFNHWNISVCMCGRVSSLCMNKSPKVKSSTQLTF